MMKKRSMIPAVIIGLSALAAAAGSRSFLGPCVHEDGTFGPCHWAGQALFGLALLMAAEAVIAVAWKNESLRKGLYIAMALTAVLGILVPGTLIGLCGMATMRCRALMRPAMTILFAVMGIASAAGVFFSGEQATERK